ncbi:YjdJ family protein [Halobacillus sp. B23F22_1]|uniref:YjdJ family protein n=1 Tax=Halobacillus sp. B23F22_1 TaxID=3459514 RepID=UPI00373E3E04
MHWFLIQASILLVILAFSTFVTWYEGSALLDNPWEWEYSTLFSQMLSGEVRSDEHISQLDYFVYAAKFHPVFPTVMVISSIYLILLIGYRLLKDYSKWLMLYLASCGCALLTISFFLMNAATRGGEILTITFMGSGLLVLCFALLMYFTRFHKIRLGNR